MAATDNWEVLGWDGFANASVKQSRPRGRESIDRDLTDAVVQSRGLPPVDCEHNRGRPATAVNHRGDKAKRCERS